MRRLQITVEESDYQLLRVLADRKHSSISAVIRGFLDKEWERIHQAWDNDPLLEVIGMADSGASLTPEEQDEIIYSPDWETDPIVPETRMKEHA